MLSFASNTIWMCSKALPALHKQGFSFIFTRFCIFKFHRGVKNTESCQIFSASGWNWMPDLKDRFSKFSGAHSKNTNNLETLCGRWNIYVNQQRWEQLRKALSKSSGEKNNTTHTAHMLREVQTAFCQSKIHLDQRYSMKHDKSCWKQLQPVLLVSECVSACAPQVPTAPPCAALCFCSSSFGGQTPTVTSDVIRSVPGFTLALWIMEFENSAHSNFWFDRLNCDKNQEVPLRVPARRVAGLPL